jgi:hypothetical protein
MHEQFLDEASKLTCTTSDIQKGLAADSPFGQGSRNHFVDRGIATTEALASARCDIRMVSYGFQFNSTRTSHSKTS